MSSRASFAQRLPRPARRTAGRTSEAQITANIRAFGVELDQEERDRIRRELGVKLGKHEASIERVTVRVRDVNGPRGGIDKLCRIEVMLSGLPSVVFESRAASLNAAFHDAVSDTERAVRRSLKRRHTRPLQATTRPAPGSGH